jgi:hypothetical protein
MTLIGRIVASALIVLSAAMVLSGRATAEETRLDIDICSEVDCAGGPQKCAEVTGTIRNEQCEEGVMCCPFPEEYLRVYCYESAT